MVVENNLGLNGGDGPELCGFGEDLVEAGF